MQVVLPFRRASATLCAIVVLLGASAQAAPPSILKVLPSPGAVKGWKQVGATQTYDGNTLFELINGEAEAIKAYSFAGCANADYAPAGSTKPELTITIFDMTDSLNAFGVFGSDRISGKPAGIGVESVLIEPSGLNFWKGRYVVRTVIFHPTPANRAAMQAFARATAARITGGGGVPATVKALPPGRQPRSEKYVRDNVAGQSFLTNAVTARYPAQGQGAELFIAQYPTPAAATAAFNRYWNYYVRGQAEGLQALKGMGNDAFKVQDRYAKNVVAAVKGRSVVGVHHARDAAKAQSLIKQALAKVN